MDKNISILYTTVERMLCKCCAFVKHVLFMCYACDLRDKQPHLLIFSSTVSMVIILAVSFASSTLIKIVTYQLRT